MKARMTTTDVAAEVKCLRRLIGMRLANVYDITPKVCRLPSPSSLSFSNGVVSVAARRTLAAADARVAAGGWVDW